MLCEFQFMSIKLYIPSNHLATSWNCPLLAYKERLLTVIEYIGLPTAWTRQKYCSIHMLTFKSACRVLVITQTVWIRHIEKSSSSHCQTLDQPHYWEAVWLFTVAHTEPVFVFEESLWVICLCDVVKLQLLVSVKGRARLSGLELRKNSLWDPSFACTEI